MNHHSSPVYRMLFHHPSERKLPPIYWGMGAFLCLYFPAVLLGNMTYIIYLVIPYAILGVILQSAIKDDPAIVEVYAMYARQSNRYDPWPAECDLRVYSRPKGFGRHQVL